VKPYLSKTYELTTAKGWFNPGLWLLVFPLELFEKCRTTGKPPRNLSVLYPFMKKSKLGKFNFYAVIVVHGAES
jgi:hypothetical protein